LSSDQEKGSAIYFVLKTGEAKLAATITGIREENMVVTVGWWLLWTATAHVPISSCCILSHFIQKQQEWIFQVPNSSTPIICASSTMLEGMAKIVCFSENPW